ncbi:MAG: biotin--[acetyl-CoA-carboxylase] ligase [Proteobacteria bacterium]|nr:biotin--[acetyl-CoA-carboxylase] ligase [Pseudomonadota bacterium]
MGLSRAAIWKQIKGLREQWGIEIHAVSGRGYRLAHPLERLQQEEILKLLPQKTKSSLSGLEIHASIDSTNEHLMQQAAAGASTGQICLAERQTAGRGRRDREWISPYDSNIYLSIFWRFSLAPMELRGLSLAAGLAVVRALNRLGTTQVGLKWPNDILWQKQKLAGLLLEVTGENEGPSQVVLGVGLIIVPMSIKSQTIKREMPILLLVSLLVLFLLMDLKLSHVDGVILLIGMLVVTGLLGYLGIKEGRDRFSDEIEAEFDFSISLKKSILMLSFGIVMLPLASHLMVIGAIDIAHHFGISDLVIGLTIVALGTSLPELAATVASTMKNEHDLAIGNIVGSNMFNLLGVIGISGVIREYEFSQDFLQYDYFYMLLLTVFLFLASVYFALKDKLLSRIIGIVLLLLYVSYMIWLYVSK